MVFISLVSSSGEQGQSSMEVLYRILTQYITTSSSGEEAQISPGLATGSGGESEGTARSLCFLTEPSPHSSGVSTIQV